MKNYSKLINYLLNLLNNFLRNFSNSYKKLSRSISLFQKNAYSGYANLPSFNKDNLNTIRTFKPRIKYKGSFYNAFSTEIVYLYDKNCLKDLENREKESEIINYRGNINKFYFLNTDDLANPKINLNFLKGKVVLFGFTGAGIGPHIMEDIFYTPLNKKYAGKTIPDMYGIVIHANIISMLISKNYINSMPSWMNILFAFIVCYFNVLMISKIKKNTRTGLIFLQY